MYAALTLALSVGSVADSASDFQLWQGVFSNEEQVYFEKDAGREPPRWISLRIANSETGWTVQEIDTHGKSVSPSQKMTISVGKKRDIITVGHCSRNFDRSDAGWSYSAIQNRKQCVQRFQIMEVNADSIKLRFSSGSETVLKRSRQVECWAAVVKKKPKEDGSPDWLFRQKLTLHDQGGRVLVGGGDTGADQVTLRMRAVHWPPPSTNRPSMVLYVHKDDPDRAASYSWADINASRVGINLRWMQASCTIEGAERSSEVTKANFRG